MVVLLVRMECMARMASAWANLDKTHVIRMVGHCGKVYVLNWYGESVAIYRP